MIILIIPLEIALLMLLQCRIFRMLWSRGLHVHLVFLSTEVREGGTCVLEETVVNEGILPLPILHLHFQTDKGLQILDRIGVRETDRLYLNEVFSVRAHERIRRKLHFKCLKRGYYRIRVADLEADDLVGIYRGRMNAPQNTHLSVFPSRLAEGSIRIPCERILGEVRARRQLYEDPFSFRGIRQYTSADPMRKINWKASGRTGRLMVNLQDFTADESVRILLNLENPAIVFDDRILEESIRLAGSLAERLLREHIPTGLTTNAEDVLDAHRVQVHSGSSAGHLRQIDEALCRIDLRGERPSFAESAAPEIRELRETDTVYCLISASLGQRTVAMAERIAAESGSLLWLVPVLPGRGEEELLPRVSRRICIEKVVCR